MGKLRIMNCELRMKDRSGSWIHNSSLPIRNFSQHGFSVLEILIAGALLLLLVIGLSSFMTESRTNTKHLMQQGDNLRETRLALAYMERDIRESIELTQAAESDSLLSFTLKRVLDTPTDSASDDVVEYVTWNYLKQDVTIDGKPLLAGSLTRGETRDLPGEGHRTAEKVLIRAEKDNRSGTMIGLIPEGEVKKTGGTPVRVRSSVQFHNAFYDHFYLEDDRIPPDRRELMKALHTWQGKYNGSVVGYTAANESVAVRLQFLMGDDRGNHELFQTVAWMRCRMLGR